MSSKLVDIWGALTSDRRKATMLAVLVGSLLFVVAKSLLPLGPNPSSAALDGGRENNSADVGRTALSRATASVAQLTEATFIEVPRSARLARDLFRVNEQYFPPPAQPDPSDQGNEESPAPQIESSEDNADEVYALLVARVKKEADRLQLRSVMIGQSPMAVLEAKRGERAVVRIGSSFQGFTLREVELESVVLEKESIRIRLWLAGPDL